MNTYQASDSVTGLLKNRFRELCIRCLERNEAIDAGAVSESIMQHYQSQTRRYHNLNHLNHCLHEFDQVANIVPEPDAVQMALWFHDVIYLPGNSDNEQKSADFFRTLIGVASDAQFAQKVVRLILATTHNGPGQDEDERFTLDIDLSSFGLPWEKFIIDSQHLREERSDITNLAYYESNRKFLCHLLDRGRIFQTDVFYRRYEQIAIENINRLLKLRLSEGLN